MSPWAEESGILLLPLPLAGSLGLIYDPKEPARGTHCRPVLLSPSPNMSHVHLHVVRSTTPEPSDAELALAARLGDIQAQGTLFRRHANVVYGLAFRLVGAREAKDVTQDTFVQALRSLDRLAEPAFFRSWLCGITVRVVRHRLRRIKLFRRAFSEDSLEQVPEHMDPGAPPDAIAELKWAYARLGRLPERQRVAFVLRRIDGMTRDEVALAMGLSVTTIKRLVTAAELRLAEEKPARRLKGLT